MAATFEFPTPKLDRDSVVLFRTPMPRRSESDFLLLAKRFNNEGRPRDSGARVLMRDRKGTLEIFQASDSVRWVSRDTRKIEAIHAPELPDPDRAIFLASTHLAECMLNDPRMGLPSVSYTQFARAERERIEVEEYPIALHVNYGYALHDIPVLGPGAKTQVTFGEDERILEFYHFWREPFEDRWLPTISVDAAIDMLRQDPAYASLREGEATVKFHRFDLAYYATPPREAQSFLVPVYAFEGTVATPFLERYDFKRYVVAINIAADEMKRMGITSRQPVPAF